MFDRVALELLSPLCTFENSTKKAAKSRSILVLFRIAKRSIAQIFRELSTDLLGILQKARGSCDISINFYTKGLI